MKASGAARERDVSPPPTQTVHYLERAAGAVLVLRAVPIDDVLLVDVRALKGAPLPMAADDAEDATGGGGGGGGRSKGNGGGGNDAVAAAFGTEPTAPTMRVAARPLSNAAEVGRTVPVMEEEVDAEVERADNGAAPALPLLDDEVPRAETGGPAEGAVPTRFAAAAAAAKAAEEDGAATAGGRGT